MTPVQPTVIVPTPTTSVSTHSVAWQITQTTPHVQLLKPQLPLNLNYQKSCLKLARKMLQIG
jgi:hypothetical protein